MTRTRPQFQFNTQDALTLGVDAAILWALIQDLAALSEDSATLSANESRWLDWLPFFSPAQFMNALETLCEAGKVVRQRSDKSGEISLKLHSSRETGNTPSSESTRSRNGESGFTSRSKATPPKIARTEDTDWADLDMPPPMPALSPMLTDNTLMMEQNASTRRRYVNEPLYQMDRDQSPNKGSSESETEAEAADSGPRQSTRMTLEWQPSEDCLNLVHNKGISSEFAMAQRESFVLYYRDSGQRQLSWDTKFFNWVCRRWQYHLNDQSHDFQANANNPTDARSRKQKLRAKLRDIGDLDW